MKTEPLILEHKPLLDPLFKKLSLNLAEYSFANLYLFRKTHSYEMIQGDDFYIRGKTRDGFSYLMPTKPIKDLNNTFLTELLQGVDFLFPIPEAWLDQCDSSRFSWSYEDQDSDYIYGVDKLRYYPGRKLDGRRNLVKQFNEQYPGHTSFPLDSDHQAAGLALLDQWKNSLPPGGSDADYEACAEALRLLEPLGLSGRIVYHENKPVAMTIGEWLNPEMYVVHFAKALVAYKGVYQFLYEDTALNVNFKTQFINLEQDLGIEALRRSKEAYDPDKKLIKYRVNLSS